MKFVLLIGNGAVGEMTVGQELVKITDLKLFHNHMSIEPVVEIFGCRNNTVVNDIRESVFKNFAKSDNYGLIFTYIWAFDSEEDKNYIEHITHIFKEQGSDIYCVELVASKEVRLKRNVTENRLNNKPSKRDLDFSRELIERADKKYRLESYDGEIPFENYIKIDNTNLEAAEVAKIIKEKFNL